jgi:hypothetical protein
MVVGLAVARRAFDVFGAVVFAMGAHLVRHGPINSPTLSQGTARSPPTIASLAPTSVF